MHGVRRERRQADRDVVGTVRRAVADPLTGSGMHGLARGDLELVVVGTGPLLKTLRQTATPNIELLGNVNDRELRWLYGHAGALIAPAFEDYGLTPLEAASFGKPTLALKRGGYLDTVSEGTSGYFFDGLDVRSISGAIDKLSENPLNSDEIREHASRFSEERFASTLRQQVSLHLA